MKLYVTKEGFRLNTICMEYIMSEKEVRNLQTQIIDALFEYRKLNPKTVVDESIEKETKDESET